MDDLINKQAVIDALIELSVQRDEWDSKEGLVQKRGIDAAICAIEDLPSDDVVEVVRCKDCKYQEKGENDCEAWNLCGYRPWLHIPTEDDAFCSKGERKDG